VVTPTRSIHNCLELLRVRCPKPVRQSRRGDTLARVVADYIRYCRIRGQAEREHFAALSLPQAVRLAGLAQTQEGKRFSHQRRIPKAVLHRSAELLLRRLPRLRACRDFDALYALIDDTVGHLRGIGTLTLYDTANRIGGKLRLEPTSVYLHAGTLDGAHALELPTQNGIVEMSDVPKQFRRLRPREVEDALCIFKGRLRRIMNGRRTGR
jgi:hypothetical protein